MARPILSKLVSALIGFLDLDDVAPAVPAANRVRLSRQSLASKQIPAFIGPNGLESMIQGSLARKNIALWQPGGNSTPQPGVLGVQALSTLGTATNRAFTTTNALTRQRRLGYVSAAAINSLVSLRVGAGQITLGDGAGLGGFFLTMQFGISDATLVTVARTFVGVSNTTAAPTDVEPSTLLNCIGVGHGAADTNFKIFYGGTTAQTPVNLGAGFPNSLNIPYELALYSPPGTANIVYWQVTRLDTKATTSGSVTGAAAVIPQSSMTLNWIQTYRSTNSSTSAVGLDFIKFYLETDN